MGEHMKSLVIEKARDGEERPSLPAEDAAPVLREESCALACVRRVAAMLDLEPDRFAIGDALPKGWHFVLLAADTRRSSLRSDGFPGLGVPMPDLGLPRLMLGGRSVSFRRNIPIGATVMRRSSVRNVSHKSTASGPMAVVTLGHDLCLASDPDPVLVETQTYLLLPSRPVGAGTPETATGSPARAAHLKTVMPDETLLFQYSALGFNSHRIHLDREHARNVEGFPDLVVNGGLSTLLMTEFLRELGVTPTAISVRHVAPLYCNRPVTLAADCEGERWRMKAYDDRHQLAVQMEVDVK
jgi:3-methylfumaryl-CoA hydratase